MLEVRAHLERVAAANDREIVSELEGILEEGARRVPIAAESLVTADGHVADDLSRNERQVLVSIDRRRRLNRRRPIECEAQIVDDVIREDVGRAHREKL